MFCPECGARNEEGTAFCGECGTRLEAEALLPPEDTLEPAGPSAKEEPAATHGEQPEIEPHGGEREPTPRPHPRSANDPQVGGEEGGGGGFFRQPLVYAAVGTLVIATVLIIVGFVLFSGGDGAGDDSVKLSATPENGEAAITTSTPTNTDSPVPIVTESPPPVVTDAPTAPPGGGATITRIQTSSHDETSGSAPRTDWVVFRFSGSGASLSEPRWVRGNQLEVTITGAALAAPVTWERGGGLRTIQDIRLISSDAGNLVYVVEVSQATAFGILSNEDPKVISIDWPASASVDPVLPSALVSTLVQEILGAFAKSTGAGLTKVIGQPGGYNVLS